MKKLIVKMHTGYIGMDEYDILVMPDDATEDEISEEAYQMALGHAESFGIYPYPDDFDENEEDDSIYSYDIEGYVIGEYDPEKHDMYRSGGGSFKDDFARYES
jgi:hypothetical protein